MSLIETPEGPTPSLTLVAIPGFPDVEPGDDLALLILDTLSEAGITLHDGDVLTVAQKIVSKAEGREVALNSVTPGLVAMALAAETDKDPRLVELILQESSEVSRTRPGLIITRHRLGFTSANAGIDSSNISQAGENGETVLLLPVDSDKSARQLQATITEREDVAVSVVVTDSHGRPFRLGTVGVAIGVAGIPALWDRRGEADRYGRILQHTDVGLADEIAAAAGLLMGQAAEGLPVVIVRGLKLPPAAGQASDLVRPAEQDLYR